MLKRLSLIVFFVLILCFSAFADTYWWEGRVITGFEIDGLKNVSSYQMNDVLYQYRGQVLTEETVSEMESKLMKIDGISRVSSGAIEGLTEEEVKVYFFITEYPLVSSITIQGQSKVRKSDIISSISGVKVGSFLSLSMSKLVETIKSDVSALYAGKGFGLIPIDVSYSLNEEKNTIELSVSVTEGIQTRILEILFEGNENATESALKKNLSLKSKSLFNQGYLSDEKLEKDKGAIEDYYKTIGYIDVEVEDVIITDLESSNENYRDVSVTFVISEHDMWYYGGMDISGNKIYSNDEFNAVMTLVPGSVLDLTKVSAQYSNIADIYYNNGYIYNRIDIKEDRNESDRYVYYHITVVEGPQAIVEKIIFSGLNKTKEYVMRRELTMKEGDVFSKSKLQTSAQNLYNTGLLKDLDYNLQYGSTENGVVLEFILEEGNQMDIQFGATFGGTANGFPISGFLQFAHRNFAHKGQNLSVSTTLSPDTQNAAVSFGDSWIGNKRWSYSVSFSITHTKFTDELQKGIGSDQYNGWNDGSAWPLGYSSYEDYKNHGFANPSGESLMSYDLYNYNLGFSTGYTFMFDVGRLTLSTGVGVGLNNAKFDADKYVPYEYLISKYQEDGLHFSNKLSLGIQWDGRDYVTNTTKGYVVSSSLTYAGGLLQGLSNYVKTSVSGTGYIKLFELGSEEKKKNVMFSAATTLSFMLPQLYTNYNDPENSGFGFHDARLGATKNEMLYIDGITIARGHRVVTGQSFLWDNMFEITYPFAEDILQAEVFLSATALSPTLQTINQSDWYFSAGAGIRLKIPGFPLGLYLVKNAVKKNNSELSFLDGPIGSMNLVVAISTSLI